MKKSAKNRKTQRAIYWFPNFILFYLLKLNIFREKNIWIYGAWEGNKYDDNSKYFFEYMVKYHPEITSVWLSNNEKVLDEVKNAGYIAYKSNSLIGLKMQLRAGYVFYTHGTDDIANISFVYGATIVALWHGIITKKGYYYIEKNKRRFKDTLRIFKKRLYSQIYRDITVASSELDKTFLIDTLLVDKKSVVITGYPRNDILNNKYDIKSIIRSEKVSNLDRILLVMPTFRPYKCSTIDEIIQHLDFYLVNKSKKCNVNIKIIVKLHYLTKINYTPKSDLLLMLTNEDVSSVQELISISSWLITDYSSCCVDFSLMDKPVYLFAPDIEYYCKTVGITKTWEDLCKKFAVTHFDKLDNILDDIFIYNSEDLRVSKQIREMFEDRKIRNTCYSQNLYEKLIG